MAPLAAPRPQRLHLLALLDAHASLPALMSPISLSDPISEIHHHPRADAPLLSPIHISDRSASLSYSKPCSPTPKRRRAPRRLPQSNLARTPRRRAPCTHASCPIINSSVSIDDLPWLPLLTAAPTHISPWDIADLSLLPVDIPGPGPVRSRKSSLRSNPLAASASPARDSADRDASPTPPSPSPQPPRLDIPFVFPLVDIPAAPRTPVSVDAVLPAQMRFHDLMPAFPDHHWN